MSGNGQINLKEESDMASDKNTRLKPEWVSNNGSGARLFAYSCAISGKDVGASSSEDKAKVGSGISGLMKELEKTKLDTCDNA